MTTLEQQWLDSLQNEEKAFLSTRDNCGYAALLFIDFVKETTGQEFMRIRGEFIVDVVLHDKDDFTKEMKNQLKKDGFNFHNTNDRKQWIENSEHKDEWQKCPHYWVVDEKGNIFDPIAKSMFVTTGLAVNVNKERYLSTQMPNQPKPK